MRRPSLVLDMLWLRQLQEPYLELSSGQMDIAILLPFRSFFFVCLFCLRYC